MTGFLRAFVACIVLYASTSTVCCTTVTSTSGTIRNNEMRVNNGDTVTLVCTVDLVDDPAGPNALWLGPKGGIAYGNRFLHYDSEKYGFSIVNKNGKTEFSVTIRTMVLADEGIYECQNYAAETGLEKRSVTIYVSTAPTINSITEMVTALPGETVRLACRAHGSPNPQVRWRHTRPNNRLPNGLDGEYKTGPDFTITSITVENRGEYECIASNGIPNATAQETNTTFIRMNYEPVVTVITDDNPEVRVPVGDKASLTCKSMGYPRPANMNISWFKDDAQISEDDMYSFETANQIPEEEADPYEETTYSILSISEVTVNTTGDYKCQFQNSVGISFAVITLNVADASGMSSTSEYTSVAETTTRDSDATTTRDYAETTTQVSVELSTNDISSKRQTETIPHIVSAVVGVIVCIIIIVVVIVVVILLMRRRRQNTQDHAVGVVWTKMN